MHLIEDTCIGIQEAAVFRCFKKGLMVVLTVNINQKGCKGFKLGAGNLRVLNPNTAAAVFFQCAP